MGVRPVLDRELLDLAQQALLAVADLADERLRRVAVERRRPAAPPRPAAHLGSSRAFIVSSRDVAARAFDSLDQRLGALSRPSSRAKNATVVSGGESASAGTRCFVTSASLRALDAVDHDDAMAHGERHRRERRGGGLGRGLVAGQDVDAGRAALALAERAEVRPALGDPAVVVPVDEIGGLE